MASGVPIISTTSCEETQEIPPRAILLYPEPIALGGPYAESLRSYFARVIELNDLSAYKIGLSEAFKKHAHNYPDLAILQRIARGFMLRGVSGTSPSGAELAMVLARMWGRPILRHLHWAASLEDFSFTYLNRECYAWCADCLRTDTIPYVRTLWETDLACACFVHGQRLTTVCHSCQRTARRFGGRDVVRCSHCGCDRRTGFSANKATPDEVTISEQIGRLIALVTSGDASARLSSSECVSALLAYAKANGASSQCEQAHFFGISPRELVRWIHRRTIPSLASVIYISLRRGVPLLEAWRGPMPTTPPKQPPINVAWKHRAHRLTAEQKSSIIERISNLMEQLPALHPKKAAKLVGVSWETLRRLAPENYARMTAQHNANKERLRAARLKWFISKVDRYVSECLADGRHPTLCGLSRQFQSPGCLRNPPYTAYARQALLRAAEQIQCLQLAS